MGLRSSIFVIHRVYDFKVFEKYYGVVNGLMTISILLDLNIKLIRGLTFFSKICEEEFDCEIKKVKIISKDLIKECKMIIKDKKLVLSYQNLDINIDKNVISRKYVYEKFFTKYHIVKKVNRQIISLNLTVIKRSQRP